MPNRMHSLNKSSYQPAVVNLHATTTGTQHMRQTVHFTPNVPYPWRFQSQNLIALEWSQRGGTTPCILATRSSHPPRTENNWLSKVWKDWSASQSLVLMNTDSPFTQGPYIIYVGLHTVYGEQWIQNELEGSDEAYCNVLCQNLAVELRKATRAICQYVTYLVG